MKSVFVYPSALDLFRLYSKTIVKSVNFGSQLAGMPCQNNHFWLDFPRGMCGNHVSGIPMISIFSRLLYLLGFDSG